MAHTLWAFAASRPAVRTLRATVSPENHASLALLRRAGFLHVGEQQDPEDGLELIYQLAADHYFG